MGEMVLGEHGALDVWYLGGRPDNTRSLLSTMTTVVMVAKLQMFVNDANDHSIYTEMKSMPGHSLLVQRSKGVLCCDATSKF